MNSSALKDHNTNSPTMQRSDASPRRMPSNAEVIEIDDSSSDDEGFVGEGQRSPEVIVIDDDSSSSTPAKFPADDTTSMNKDSDDDRIHEHQPMTMPADRKPAAVHTIGERDLSVATGGIGERVILNYPNSSDTDSSDGGQVSHLTQWKPTSKPPSRIVTDESDTVHQHPVASSHASVDSSYDNSDDKNVSQAGKLERKKWPPTEMAEGRPDGPKIAVPSYERGTAHKRPATNNHPSTDSDYDSSDDDAAYEREVLRRNKRPPTKMGTVRRNGVKIVKKSSSIAPPRLPFADKNSRNLQNSAYVGKKSTSDFSRIMGRLPVSALPIGRLTKEDCQFLEDTNIHTALQLLNVSASVDTENLAVPPRTFRLSKQVSSELDKYRKSPESMALLLSMSQRRIPTETYPFPPYNSGKIGGSNGRMKQVVARRNSQTTQPEGTNAGMNESAPIPARNLKHVLMVPSSRDHEVGRKTKELISTSGSDDSSSFGGFVHDTSSCPKRSRRESSLQSFDWSSSDSNYRNDSDGNDELSSASPREDCARDEAQVVPARSLPRRKRRRTKSFKMTETPPSDSDCLLPNRSVDRSRTNRKREEYETDGADPEEGALLDEVPHLSRTFENHGHPVRVFSVLDGNETLYDFKLHVKQSEIPNSGLGGFLTFLGARELKKEFKERSDLKLSTRVPYVPLTMKELHAQTSGGYGVSVKLTGSNLHGNQNKTYWPETIFPAEAVMPSGKNVSVTLAGKNLHYDSEDEEEPLNLSICPKRIGFLGLHVNSDYVPSPDKTFSNSLGVVDLGRYGPMLKSDRKSRTYFDVKNFVFNFEPSFWNFGVEEKLHGDDQIIDISSDGTGEPHDSAKAGIMMYVNEVGHSTEYEQNVDALEKHDRSVHYYFNVKRPLRKGETVELLVDYKAPYEPSRERKGYGKASLNDGVRSDEHEATRLKRNFDERKEMEELVGSLSLVKLYDLIDTLYTKILKPVAAATGAFLKELSSGPVVDQMVVTESNETPIRPSILQWIAKRRLHWIGQLLEKRVDELAKELDITSLPSAHSVNTFPYRGIIGESRELIQEMKWNDVDRLVSLLNRTGSEYEKHVHDAVVDEMREEVLYELPRDFVAPLSEALWCPVGVRLTKDLCALVWNRGSWMVEQRNSKVKLVEAFLRSAKSAAETIRKACAATSSHRVKQELCFDSGTRNGSCVDGSYLKRFMRLNSSLPMAAENSTIPKGVKAAVADIQKFCDACEAGSLETMFDLTELVLPTDGDFVVTKCNRPPSRGDAIPRRYTDNMNGKEVNEEWYLKWQVVYVVDVFARTFLARDFGSHGVYSLERLCQEVRVSVGDARKMLDHGIKRDYKMPSLLDQEDSGSPRKAAKRRARNSPTVKPALFFGIIWKTLEKLEWTIETGTRPNDRYYLPPGVARGKGFKQRVDFFDSVVQVQKFITEDPRWKDNAEVIASVELHRSCTKLYDNLKSKRQLPKDRKVTVDWLISELGRE